MALMDYISKFTYEEKIKEYEERLAKVLAMGGSEAVAKQHSRGKLTARECVDRLYDPGTFVEMMPFLKHREHLYGFDKREIPAEAVVTGYGQINGRWVACSFQDFTSMGGTMAERHAVKISKMLGKYAMEMRMPYVFGLDSGGARLIEGIQAGLAGFARIFLEEVRASGSIPQIDLVLGPSGGGGGYLPAFVDITFMVKGSSLFIGGPDFCKSVTGEVTTVEELGGWKVHGRITGLVDRTPDTPEEAIDLTKELLDYLPSSYEQPLPIIKPTDSPDRKCPKLMEIVPEDQTKPYDMHKVLEEIVDDGKFFELKPEYARNLITGFARFDGIPVGILANQPNWLGGAYEAEAGRKAGRFIRFCDCFGIPLLFLVDNPAYLVGTDQERKGVILHGIKHLYAYCEATVAKIAVVLRKGYAGGIAGMGSMYMGSDMIMAWPTAVIAIVAPEAVRDIVFPATKYSEEERAEFLETFMKRMFGPWYVAEKGLIDDVIRPEETRIRIIKCLRALKNKKASLPPKKHGNIIT